MLVFHCNILHMIMTFQKNKVYKLHVYILPIEYHVQMVNYDYHLFPLFAFAYKMHNENHLYIHHFSLNLSYILLILHLYLIHEMDYHLDHFHFVIHEFFHHPNHYHRHFLILPIVVQILHLIEFVLIYVILYCHVHHHQRHLFSLNQQILMQLDLLFLQNDFQIILFCVQHYHHYSFQFLSFHFLGLPIFYHKHSIILKILFVIS